MKKIRILKIGGASLKKAKSVRHLLKILKKEPYLIIVVSAIGKTTNALESLVEGYKKHDKNMIEGALEIIRNIHEPIIKDLFHEEIFFQQKLELC